MASLPFSPQQTAIVEFTKDPTKKGTSLVVEARAGAGKTSVIMEAAYQSGDPSTILCAFNRRIADELIERLSHRPIPRGRMIKAQTLHGIGLAIVSANERVQLDRDATDQLVRDVLPNAAGTLKRAVVKAVRYIKETCTPWDNSVALMQLVGDLGVLEVHPDPGEVTVGVQEVMTRSKTYRPTIDFCDMIWRPYVLDLMPRGRYKTVVVDEAQDLSLGQFYLIERLIAPGGRLILVGDLHQEIYEWRGAEGPTIWKIMREKYRATFLPLTWSFRCARSIVEQARELVPTIEARPDAPAGKVDRLLLSDALKQIAIGDFFLSRTNAGAVTSAIRCYLRGGSVRVLGGYDELEPLLQLLQKLDLTDLYAFRDGLQKWKDKELDKDITTAQADRIEDRYDLLMDASQLVDPKRLAPTLRALFKPSDSPAAIFSTVHKAKGLEAPRVFLLRSTFERHRKRRDGSAKPLSEISTEELNIEYVAITRAIDHLSWVIEDHSPDLVDDYENPTDVLPPTKGAATKAVTGY